WPPIFRATGRDAARSGVQQRAGPGTGRADDGRVPSAPRPARRRHPARGGAGEAGGPDQPGGRRAAGRRRADGAAQAALDPNPLVGGGGAMSPTTPPGDDTLTPELVVLLEAACDRFEAAWQAGGRPALEDHLVAMPEAGRAALFRELMTL